MTILEVMSTLKTPHPRVSVSHVAVDAMLDSVANEEYAANREGRALPSAYMESPRPVDEFTMVSNITKGS